jgi:hypothetical protein
LLESPQPDVRLSALKALIALDPSRGGPHLSQAMKDPDRAVRRRASLLALGLSGPAALQLGIEGMRDKDGDVRRVAALVLGAAGGERSRASLLMALGDKDVEVRQAAAQSLSRVLGKDVSSVVSLDDAQRHREIRRIRSGRPDAVSQPPPSRKAAPTGAQTARGEQQVVRSSAQASGGETARGEPKPVRGELVEARAASGASLDKLRTQVARPVATEAVAPRAQAPVVRATNGQSPAVAPRPAAAQARTAVAVVDVPDDAAIASAILTEIRCAIRGRTLDELTSLPNQPTQRAHAVLEGLLSRGDVVRRGQKFFLR